MEVRLRRSPPCPPVALPMQYVAATAPTLVRAKKVRSEESKRLGWSEGSRGGKGRGGVGRIRHSPQLVPGEKKSASTGRLGQDGVCEE